MNDSTKKIFILLITVVALVVIGAFVLNLLMPNVIAQMINAVEAQIKNATGLEFDFNGDGAGSGKSFTDQTGDTGSDVGGGVGVQGFN